MKTEQTESLMKRQERIEATAKALRALLRMPEIRNLQKAVRLGESADRTPLILGPSGLGELIIQTTYGGKAFYPNPRHWGRRPSQETCNRLVKTYRLSARKLIVLRQHLVAKLATKD